MKLKKNEKIGSQRPTKSPPSLMMILLPVFIAALMVFPLSLLESFLSGQLDPATALFRLPAIPAPLAAILKSLVIVALIEEGSKFLLIRNWRKLPWQTSGHEKPPRSTGINAALPLRFLLAFITGFAFAMSENALHSLFELRPLLIRSSTALPLHIICALFSAQAVTSKKLRWFWIAVIIHGLYDFPRYVS